MAENSTDLSRHAGSPVFVIVGENLLPRGTRFGSDTPSNWQQVPDSAEVNVAALVIPMLLEPNTWRLFAGPFQHLKTSNGNLYSREDPVTTAVREVAKIHGYQGAVELSRPDFTCNLPNQSIEYRYWAHFGTPAFVNHTFNVVISIKGIHH